jgi:hypothetical protein
MSAPESQHKPQAKPTTRVTASETEELKVVQHSQLFYWWPVWAAGFIMFLISYIGGELMVVVPKGPKGKETEIERTADGYKVEVKHGTPPGQIAGLNPNSTMTIDDSRSPFHVHVSPIKGLGVIFAAVLILVILVTNVPLRGMWSVVVIITGVLLVVIISLMPGWWEAILSTLTWLDIRINAAGYLVISTALFIIWAVTFFLFDRQIYIIFTPGQMKVREQIGGGETVYDTAGMTSQHLQDDFFRHRILGLGSGDLTVRTAGAHSHEFRWSNVLFVRRKLQQIEDMQREKPVVAGG